MKFQKLESTDAFVVFDLDAASSSVGVARLAPKVLRDGAELLARSVTYTYAAFGVEGWAGASAGINARAEARDAAVSAFVEELTPLAESGALRLQPGLGLTNGDLAALGDRELGASLLVEGAVAAAAGAVGDGSLSDRRMAVVGAAEPLVDALREELTRRGGALSEGGDNAPRGPLDVLFVAGKAGSVDHDAAAGIEAHAVVPLSSVPVSARAYAVLRKAGSTYVPDFVSTAAPLLALAGLDDPVARVDALAAELASSGPDMFMAAVDRAETFLTTWQDEKPFGRPL
jgi:hypothetical protein